VTATPTSEAPTPISDPTSIPAVDAPGQAGDLPPGGAPQQVEGATEDVVPFGQTARVEGIEVRIDHPRALSEGLRKKYGALGAKSTMRLELVNRTGAPLRVEDLMLLLDRNSEQVPLDRPPFQEVEADRDRRGLVPDGGRLVMTVGLGTPPDGEYEAILAYGMHSNRPGDILAVFVDVGSSATTRLDPRRRVHVSADAREAVAVGAPPRGGATGRPTH